MRINLGITLRRLVAAVAFAAAIALGQASLAVVVSSTTLNSTAPPDDPGFANVGRSGGGTAVYIGNQWALSAWHVTSTAFTWGATSYNVVQSIQLTNPDSSTTDLRLFRIDGDPGLPSLSLASWLPLVGSQVTMIGNGRLPFDANSDNMPDPTYWDGSWNEVTSSDPYDYEGYQTSPTKGVRWGNNLIEQTGVFSLGTHGFLTQFDQNGLQYEAQAVAGDSGGGVFYTNGSQWELLGIMLGVATISGQPGGVNTAVFGNQTFMADLSVYRNQILAITIPEPGTGIMLFTAAIACAAFGRRRRRGIG
ncbi:MAG: PEP-CTERM sorting domain-containing protein [Thermoguttaceae bacterium]|jgi:hypothetical protein|nr:PEP-CTERM sorting domain-containing protein [Thermoguttaceae bacterium]